MKTKTKTAKSTAKMKPKPPKKPAILAMGPPNPKKIKRPKIEKPKPREKPRQDRRVKNSAHPKSDMQEMDHRIQWTIEFLLRGMTRYQIWKHVTNQEKRILEAKAAKEKGFDVCGYWDVSLSSIDKYMMTARAEIKGAKNYDRGEEIGKSLRRYEMFINRLAASGDLRGAMMVQARIDELLGLDFASDISLRLAELQERVAAACGKPVIPDEAQRSGDPAAHKDA